MMLCSIREEIPKNQQKRPVALMIPVNLRNYFPSQSMTNFFGWIEVGYIFSDETTFEDVLLSVKKQFEEELVKEKIAMSMTNFFGWIEVGYIFSDDRSQSGKQEHYGSLF